MTEIDLYGGGPDRTLPPQIQMLQLASAHVAARAVHAYASTGIADALGATPRSVAEIAQAAAVRPDELHRLLRFLATIGVVREDETACFAATALGEALRPGGLSVVRDNTRLVGSMFFWYALADLGRQLVTGDVAFKAATGRSFYEHLDDNPGDAAVFNAAMDTLSSINIPAILAAYDFSSYHRIVDIAGGKGALISAILKKYPTSRGVLFDFRSVLEGTAVAPGISERLECISGNFFDTIPSEGDAYILRQVLHNWNDGDAARILRRCREAITKDERLLVIETAPPRGANQGNNWAALDLLMMVLLGGRERTLAEFEQLLSQEGFRPDRIIPTRSPFSIIECSPI
jgi:hypothetical protein